MVVAFRKRQKGSSCYLLVVRCCYYYYRLTKSVPVLPGISVNLLSKGFLTTIYHNTTYTPPVYHGCHWNHRIDAFGFDNFILLGMEDPWGTSSTRGWGLSTIHLRVYHHVHHFFIGWCGRTYTHSSLAKNWFNVQLLWWMDGEIDRHWVGLCQTWRKPTEDGIVDLDKHWTWRFFKQQRSNLEHSFIFFSIRASTSG